jgi:ubiquitin-protein ligase
MDTLEETLSTMKNKIQVKRLRNDCKLLLDTFDGVILAHEEDKVNVTVTERLGDNKLRSYKFVIDSNYPFHPPETYVNKVKYSSMLKLNGELEKNMAKKMKGQDCLCCHSLQCRANWSPAIRLFHIIDEIKNTIEFKRDVVNILLAEKIKARFNIPYAEIETYLV